MRLFAAIDVTERERQAISSIDRVLRSALADAREIRWVPPDRMHLTLAFAAGATADQAAAAVAALSAPIAAAPFDVAFDRVGEFRLRGSPQVLWVGVGSGCAPLASLHREVANRWSACGLPLDDRPFRPHLTLARWRQGSGSRGRRGSTAPADGPTIDALNAAVQGRLPIVIAVNHVTVYESRLGSAGPTYTPLARANLTGC